jgi:hypothetical protein
MPDDVPVLSSEFQEMKDLVTQTVNAMNALQNDIRSIHHAVERVDKRVSTQTDRVEQIEINPPKPDDNKNKEEDDDDGFLEIEDDVVYGSDGLPDNIKTN